MLQKKNGFKTKNIKNIVFIIILFSLILGFIPANNYINVSKNASAVGNSNFYTINLANMDNKTKDDMLDYIDGMDVETLTKIVMDAYGFNNIYFFDAGHTYYVFLSGIFEAGNTLFFNNVKLKNTAIYSIETAAVGFSFMVWAVHINISGYYNLSATNSATGQWCPVDIGSHLMLHYTNMFDTPDNNSTGAWFIEDIYFYHLSESAIIMSIDSWNPINYHKIQNISADSVGWNNFTTDGNYFRGDIYMLLYIIDSYNLPTITVTYGAKTYDGTYNYFRTTSTGDLIIPYHILGLYTYNFDEVGSVDVEIDNTEKYGSTTGIVSILTTTTASSYSGFWADYSNHMGAGVYNVWVNSSYRASVRLYVYDGINPLENIFVVILGVSESYIYTDEGGYTDYFILAKNILYHFDLYDMDNNHFGFDYTPVYNIKTLYILFTVSEEGEEYIYLNITQLLQGGGNTHARIRYYYFLPDIDTYKLSIIHAEDNVTVFTKILYSNTGYLDYFFRSNGTYYYNITHRYTNVLHNSNMINITDSYSNYYFYPQYTPFRLAVSQQFYYYNNMSTANITMRIPDTYINYPTIGVGGYDNLSFGSEKIYYCNIYAETFMLKQEKFAVYGTEHSAKIVITNNSDGSKNIHYEHNFIGEGCVFLRISGTPTFTNKLYPSTEISATQTGDIALNFQGENATYYLDIFLENMNIEIAFTSTHGTGVGNETTEPTEYPEGINPILDLSSIISSFGVSLTAGYYIIGIAIIVGFAVLFMMLTGNGAAALIGGLFGCIICLILGFLPLWVGVLIGVVAAGFVVFAFSGKLRAPPSAGGGGSEGGE